jgi:hypothetical protein
MRPAMAMVLLYTHRLGFARVLSAFSEIIPLFEKY